MKKELYRNPDLYKRTKRRQSKRYYAKYDKYEKRPFTEDDDTLILAHEITDPELSKQIRQSVQRIQSRRNYLKHRNRNAGSRVNRKE